jgi:hypothetical protein
MIWSTYLPHGAGLAVAYNRKSGLVVGGCTDSTTGFPTTKGAFQRMTIDVNPRPDQGNSHYPRLCVDGYVARFTIDGELTYSTLLGGSSKDLVNSVSMDDVGYATVMGTIAVPPNNLKDIVSIGTAEFVAKLNPLGTDVLYFTGVPPGRTPNGPPHVVNPDGSLGVFRWGSRFDLAGGYSTLGIDLYTITEVPERTPRIDAMAVNTVQLPNADGLFQVGYVLTVRGKGFGEGAQLRLDGSPMDLEPTGSIDQLKAKAFLAPRLYQLLIIISLRTMQHTG